MDVVRVLLYEIAGIKRVVAEQGKLAAVAELLHVGLLPMD